MINSIRNFIEKETYELENIMRKFVEGELDLDTFGKELQEKSLQLTRDILEETVESSYEKGGRHAGVSGWVSKETVKELVHNTVVEMPKKECGEKKKIRSLHIEADEDHVAARFYEKKGDLEKGENGRKNNTLMPRLVLVYEDIEEESGENSKSRRYRLTGKRYFCGLYSGKENEKLWEEVRDYICETYDWESLETIYIAGDGAGWIKAGREVLEKGKFVPDRFHMGKYIDRSVSHLLDSAAEVKEEIYEALEKGKKGRVREIYKKSVG